MVIRYSYSHWGGLYHIKYMLKFERQKTLREHYVAKCGRNKGVHILLELFIVLWLIVRKKYCLKYYINKKKHVKDATAQLIGTGYLWERIKIYTKYQVSRWRRSVMKMICCGATEATIMEIRSKKRILKVLRRTSLLFTQNQHQVSCTLKCHLTRLYSKSVTVGFKFYKLCS